MIPIIGSILISLGIGIRNFRNASYRDLELIIFPMLIGAIIGATISTLATILAPTVCDTPKSQPIFNLSTDPGISGKFYLGSGYVDQQLMYFYYTQEPDGAYMPHSVRAGLGRIYELEDVSPSVTIYTAEIDPWFAWATPFSPRTQCEVIFKVPPGSVNHNYQVG